jgi:hypothetical protein
MLHSINNDDRDHHEEFNEGENRGFGKRFPARRAEDAGTGKIIAGLRRLFRIHHGQISFFELE